MAMIQEGAAPKKPAAPKAKKPSIDQRRQRLLELMDLQAQARAPRVDRDLTPPRTEYGDVRQAPYEVPGYARQEPTYPLEDVDPMDLLDNLQTLMRMKQKRDALNYRQQPMYRTPTYEVPVEPPVYRF